MKTILISVDYFLCISSSGGFYLALVIIITLRHRSMNEWPIMDSDKDWVYLSRFCILKLEYYYKIGLRSHFINCEVSKN